MMSKFQELILATDYVAQSYSGRGMYGSCCLGFLASGPDWIADLIIAAREMDDEDTWDELDQAIRNHQTDSIGLRKIIYFPGVKFTGEVDLEEDEVDDEAPEDTEV